MRILLIVCIGKEMINIVRCPVLFMIFLDMTIDYDPINELMAINETRWYLISLENICMRINLMRLLNISFHTDDDLLDSLHLIEVGR